MGAPESEALVPPAWHARQFHAADNVRGAHLLFLLLALTASGGCSWTARDGTRHVVIIGLGIVSQTNQLGMTVQDVRGLGLVIDDAVNFGLVQRHRVEIDPQRAS